MVKEIVVRNLDVRIWRFSSHETNITREPGLTNVRKPMLEAGYTNVRPPSHLHALSVIRNNSI